MDKEWVNFSFNPSKYILDVISFHFLYFLLEEFWVITTRGNLGLLFFLSFLKGVSKCFVLT